MYTLAACTPRPPSTSTTIRLTAQRNDTGTWTAKFGDFQMIIEHKHFNDNSPSEEQDGTWTLKVKHTHTVNDVRDEASDKKTVMQHYSNTSAILPTPENKLGYEQSNNEHGTDDLLSTSNENNFDQHSDDIVNGQFHQLFKNNEYEPGQSPNNNENQQFIELSKNQDIEQYEQSSSNRKNKSEETEQMFRNSGDEFYQPSEYENEQLFVRNKTSLVDHMPENNEKGTEERLSINIENKNETEEQLIRDDNESDKQLSSHNQNEQYEHLFNNENGPAGQISNNSKNILDKQPFFINNDNGTFDQLSRNNELNETRAEENSMEEKMTSEEREHYMLEQERKNIMERYPRSRSLGYDAREYDLETKGYSYFPEVGWVRLNTAHWQWDQARKSCEADGGHLAIPDTLLKIKTFTRILKRNISIIERAVLKNQVFVGVYVPNNDRKFVTVKGEPFMPESVSIWFPNEPNNADPGEDCVTMHLEGKLRDVPCFYNLPFLCQIY